MGDSQSPSCSPRYPPPMLPLRFSHHHLSVFHTSSLRTDGLLFGAETGHSVHPCPLHSFGMNEQRQAGMRDKTLPGVRVEDAGPGRLV